MDNKILLKDVSQQQWDDWEDVCGFNVDTEIRRIASMVVDLKSYERPKHGNYYLYFYIQKIAKARPYLDMEGFAYSLKACSIDEKISTLSCLIMDYVKPGLSKLGSVLVNKVPLADKEMDNGHIFTISYCHQHLHNESLCDCDMENPKTRPMWTSHDDYYVPADQGCLCYVSYNNYTSFQGHLFNMYGTDVGLLVSQIRYAALLALGAYFIDLRPAKPKEPIVIVLDDDIPQPPTSASSAQKSGNCSICFERDSNALISPCHHMYCYDCVSQLEKCPVCAVEIKEIIRGFLN